MMRALAALVLAANLGLPAATSGGFANARLPWTFAFPRDHGAHPEFRSEWWYFTGHLTAADGRTFGYELTFFRYGLRPGDPAPPRGSSRWRGHEIYPVHLALTDERAGTFLYDERVARGVLGLGRAAQGRLDLAAGGWTLRGADFRMHAAAAALGLDLTHTAEKPPAIHGHDGVSVKGSCATCASHYYSMTRLRTAGTLRYRGERLRVTGISWMDHEFGSDELQRDQAGWDWFAVQLDDRRELMLYRLRQRDGSITPESSGSLIEADGRVRFLPRNAVQVDATGSWRSGRTDGVYPSGWRVRVPSAGVDVMLIPTVRDQELANTAGGVSYWEGSVRVNDVRSGERRGAGYVELTGYAGSLPL